MPGPTDHAVVVSEILLYHLGIRDDDDLAGVVGKKLNIVFGLETDFNYFGLKGSSTGSGIYPCCVTTGFTVNTSVSTDWLITFRPRLGIASNNWLFYIPAVLRWPM